MGDKGGVEHQRHHEDGFRYTCVYFHLEGFHIHVNLGHVMHIVYIVCGVFQVIYALSYNSTSYIMIWL